MKSTRWWEYYVVRYFVGTVIGAGAVLMFDKYSVSPLKGTLCPALSNFKDAPYLLVLVALGLTYCYVASAPVLTLHALRGQVDLANRRFPWSLAVVLWTAAIFVALFLVAYLLISPPLWSLQFWGIVFVCLVLALQGALFAYAFFGNFERVATYYVKLSAARASNMPSTKEYVQSGL